MVSIRADGYEVPLVLRVNGDGLVEVPIHLLHIRYGFIQSSIYVEEEIMSKSGALLESILMSKTRHEYGHF